MRRIALCVALWTVAGFLTPARGQKGTPPRLGPPDGLLAVNVAGKHGFIDTKGRIVIPPAFDYAHQFSEGRAVVWVNGHAGYIDRSGKFVIWPRFERAQSFHEGMAAVQLGSLWGFINTDGQFAIQPQFDEVRWFSDGRAQVRIDGRWGFVDSSGRLVIPANYRQAAPFHDGRALVQLGEKWLVIDHSGEPLQDGDDLFPERRNGKWGFVSLDGTVAVPFMFDGFQNFSEGLAGVLVGERWGFVNRQGRLVIPPEYQDPWTGPIIRGGPPIGRFSEGVAAVYKDGNWRFIDAKGRIALPGQFANVGMEGFQNGIITVCGTQSCGYIDKSGRVIWPWE
jgi:DNA-binding transcriptional regulator/RsmH inhibitor MraZ